MACPIDPKAPQNPRGPACPTRQGKPLLLALTLLALASIATLACRPKVIEGPESFSRFADMLDGPYGQDLPLVAVNRTFYESAYIVGKNCFRITDKGILVRDARSSLSGATPLDSDVRTFALTDGIYTDTFLYIKNDNSLWGFGENIEGILGDGTSVDRPEPLKIMDDVAVVGRHGDEAYAIKTDKTLWTWGAGVLSPTQKANNVIKYLGKNQVQTGDGVLLDFEKNTVLRMPVLSESNGYSVSLNGQLTVGQVTCEDVIKVIGIGGGNVLFIKSDNTLWGYGPNSNGELGDSTKESRKEDPVKIADKVKEAYYRSYLTEDGQLWRWDSEDPTPQLYLENIAEILVLGDDRYEMEAIGFLDGSWRYFETYSYGYLKEVKSSDMDAIMVPTTLTFP